LSFKDSPRDSERNAGSGATMLRIKVVILSVAKKP